MRTHRGISPCSTIAFLMTTARPGRRRSIRWPTARRIRRRQQTAETDIPIVVRASRLHRCSRDGRTTMRRQPTAVTAPPLAAAATIHRHQTVQTCDTKSQECLLHPAGMRGHATDCSANRNPSVAGGAGNGLVRSLRQQGASLRRERQGVSIAQEVVHNVGRREMEEQLPYERELQSLIA